MNRDGHQKSLWQDGIEDFTPKNSWDKGLVYDALIVGGGITGLTTALLLQESGKKCIIAEAHTLGFGTTSGTTAHLNTMLDSPYNIIERDFGKEGAMLISDAGREAIDLIEDLICRYDIQCGFRYRSGYLFAQDEKEEEELETIVEASVRAGCVVSPSPQIPVPLPYTKAYRFEFQAQFHSTKYLMALAEAFEAAGGVILQQCVVQSADDNDPVTASTSLGDIKAHKLVHATHVPPGISILHFRCAPYRSYAMACQLSDDNYPDGLAYDMKDPYHYFRTQEKDGKKYLIAGGFDHKTGHKENTDQVFMQLEAYLRGIYNVRSIEFKWSSQYFNSADGLPYIGLLPGHKNTYAGTGYSGNGLVLGTLAGIMITRAINREDCPYAELLKPSRIKPIAGFTEFLKENADVVSQFIGKRFAYEKISTLAELAKGEAVLAEWDGKNVALYKDEQGKVTAVDPVCPHAGCIVAWNSAEQSWDCPCHGARYRPDGELVTGPSRKNLTPLIWEEMDGD